jgi:hypothetical protein
MTIHQRFAWHNKIVIQPENSTKEELLYETYSVMTIHQRFACHNKIVIQQFIHSYKYMLGDKIMCLIKVEYTVCQSLFLAIAQNKGP